MTVRLVSPFPTDDPRLLWTAHPALPPPAAALTNDHINTTNCNEDGNLSKTNPLPAIDLSTTTTATSASQALETAARTVGAASSPTCPSAPSPSPSSASRRLQSCLSATQCLTKIDQKTTIDLSVARLQELRRLDPALIQELGEDFEHVLRFYSVVEADVLPVLMQATSDVAGADLAPLHAQRNTNLRLIDYFDRPAATATAKEGSGVDNEGPRCGEHRDYGIFTVVFQDREVGGLEFEVDGQWRQVPVEVDAVVSWGWCGAVLSNDAITAAKHRPGVEDNAACAETHNCRGFSGARFRGGIETGSYQQSSVLSSRLTELTTLKRLPVFYMPSLMSGVESTPDESKLSIYELARLYCRERLLVDPLWWTGRHVELLQFTFETPTIAPNPKPGEAQSASLPEKYACVDKVPNLVSGVECGPTWREGAMSSLMNRAGSPFTSKLVGFASYVLHLLLPN
ncbi:hypothetical protein AJ79_08322 [Helicocarpus griseus UAMH5409]|uniref:Isopenicillin N synthase-like Fe(2+) 2OG dioxygenase domain-containing protein n=1 Tax=Helicocarpus griseus UAMH5409 TaxID=1447875 RepID=A0A2B7WU81_9EURO|nr:hypothetical protein AJ79_08322 [Helicocarpus griseus UAMH5409]